MGIKWEKNMELTILIPALNEETTIGECIKKAKQFLESENIQGEILVANNKSTDKTEIIAKNMGARVINVQKKGYGIALIEGNKVAKGKYTIMGDADDSYNFLELNGFLKELRNGTDLVIGNRFKGNMEKGSMKFLHRYIGTPMISYLARKKYKIPVGDFNCGLRGYVTEKIKNLNCEASGMEYATEMLIKASQADLIIGEIPINFYKDKRNKKSHLRTVRDGIRHLKVIIEKAI